MNATRICSVAGCDATHYGKGFCQKHYTRQRRTGDPNTVRVGHRYGSKGSDIGIRAAHKRVYITRGPARNYDCVSCGRQATEWAYDHSDPNEKLALRQDSKDRYLVAGAYSVDPTRYQPMCRSCHRRFDLSMTQLRPRHRRADGTFAPLAAMDAVKWPA